MGLIISIFLLITQDEVQQDEVQQDEVQQDEDQQDEDQQDEVQKDEVQKDEVQQDEDQQSDISIYEVDEDIPPEELIKLEIEEKKRNIEILKNFLMYLNSRTNIEIKMSAEELLHMTNRKPIIYN